MLNLVYSKFLQCLVWDLQAEQETGALKISKMREAKVDPGHMELAEVYIHCLDPKLC
jgi:hypothetical protein